MSQRRRAVGNTVSDLTGPRFEPQTSRSRDERVTARPTGRLSSLKISCRSLNITLLIRQEILRLLISYEILQKILRNHPFLMLRKFTTHGYYLFAVMYFRG